MSVDRGSLVLVNGTPYTWQLTYVHSNQIAQWDSAFPRTIAPFSSAAVCVERSDSISRDGSQDRGEGTYELLTSTVTASPPSFQVQARAGGGQPFRLRVWLKNLAVQDTALGGTVPIGAQGTFLLAGRGPVYVCNDPAEAWLQASLGSLGARSFGQLCMPDSHERHTVLTNVLSHLPPSALARVSLVSRAWRAIVDSDPVLWRELLKSNELWFGGDSERAYADALFAQRARSQPPPDAVLPLPHPYKLLFKTRHLTRTRWLENDPPRPLSFPAHGSAVVTCLLVSHDRIISASDQHSILIHSLYTGRLLKSLDDHNGGVWALAATRNTLVSSSTDRTVRIWDLEEGRCTHVFGGHTSTVRCLAIVKPVWVDVQVDEFTKRRERWPKRTLIVTGSRDQTLRVWKLPKEDDEEYKWHEVYEGDGELPEDVSDNPYHERVLEGHDDAVRALAARGRTAVSGSYDCTVRVWDIITGECKWVLVGHTQNVYSVVLDHSRNRVCSSSMDSTVRVWSLETGQCVHTLTGHTFIVGFLGLSSSRLVSAGSDSTVRVWDADSGQLVHTLAAHSGAITCFQHDEFKVVSGCNGALKLWDMRTGRLVRDLLTDVTGLGVWQLAFRGRWCVAASERAGGTYLDVWDFGRKGNTDEDWDVTGTGNMSDDEEDDGVAVQ